MESSSSLTSKTNTFFKTVEAIPLVVPAILAAFGVVAMVFLLLGELHNLYVWGVGLPVSIITAAVTYKYAHTKRPGTRRAKRTCDLLIVLGVVLWACFNFFYTSQHVITDRDPATYAVAGAELIENTDLEIIVDEAFGNQQGIVPYSAGFSRTSDNSSTSTISAQGQHLLPVFLGLGGRIVGETYALGLNVLFGATALLAFYGFARLLMRPYWALVGTAAFGLSLPLIYFSRDTYTEPLLATFVFGSLSLLWLAQKKQKRVLWFLAGLVAGAGALTRIDAYLVFIGVIAALAIYLAFQPEQKRREASYNTMTFIVGAAIVSLVGWLDVLLLSSYYYQNIESRFLPLLLAVGGVIVLGVAFVALAWRTNILQWLNNKMHKWVGYITAGGVLLSAVILASQPLWRVSHLSQRNGIVVSIQKSMGGPVNGTRDYAELAAHWISWYLGPTLAVLGVAGLAYFTYCAVQHKKFFLLPFLFIVIGTSTLYMVFPNITPDHIWASRRFLPIIFPGFIVLGSLVLSRLSTMFLRNRDSFTKTGITFIVTVAVLLGPLLTTEPFLTVRARTQLSSIQDVCTSLPNDAAVLWLGMAKLELVQSTNTYCNVPAFNYNKNNKNIPSREDLARAAQHAQERGYTPFVGVYGKHAGIVVDEADPDKQYDLTNINKNTYLKYEKTLTRPPQKVRQKSIDILVGKINADGRIDPLQ